MTAAQLRDVGRIVLTGCGTALHAAMIGEYILEQLAGIPTEVEYASEFRHRNSPMTRDTLVFAISQSGETADTLGALRESRRKGYRALGICNNVASTIARESDGGVYMHAGPGDRRGRDEIVHLASHDPELDRAAAWTDAASFHVRGHTHYRGLGTIAGADRRDVEAQRRDQSESRRNTPPSKGMLFFGRQFNFPVALEAALKMKEITYLFAEGHPSAELKHGIIALIGADLPSVFIVPDDAVFSKNLNNMEQVKARKGPLIAVTSGNGAEQLREHRERHHHCAVDVADFISPILTVIPLQLLAYHLAVELGRDVDKPRNLAKSVTVE